MCNRQHSPRPRGVRAHEEVSSYRELLRRQLLRCSQVFLASRCMYMPHQCCRFMRAHRHAAFCMCQSSSTLAPSSSKLDVVRAGSIASLADL